MRALSCTTLFILTASVESVFACGTLKGRVGEDRALQVRFDDGSVTDDSGMLVAGIIAAKCAFELEGAPFPRITFEQRKCAENAFPMFRTRYPRDGQVEAVKAACGFDQQAMLDAEQKRMDEEPLKCAPAVNTLAKKAADRYKIVAEEQAEPAALKRLKLDKDAKEKFLASLNVKQQLMSELAQITADSSTKRKSFESWLGRYRDLIKTKQFKLSMDGSSIVMMAGDEIIGLKMGLAVSDTSDHRTMCASPIDQVLKDLADKDWPHGKDKAPSPARGAIGR